MLLLLDINQMAEPIVKEAGYSSFLVRILSFFKRRFASKLNPRLDAFILSLEGSFQHISELDSNEAKDLLSDTKKIIDDFYLINEDLKKDNYLDDQSLNDKFQYLLKTLYKFESKLHKITYKDSPIVKTPDGILSGISKINKRNLSKLS